MSEGATPTASVKWWVLATAMLFSASPASAFEGVWHGKYNCMQGPTAVTLTITRDMAAHSWNARFCFCALRENPNLPTGEFELDAPMAPGETVVSLTPRRWISQPPGWIMVPVELWRLPDGSIAGLISAPGCSSFAAQPIGNAAQPRCQCGGIPAS